MVVMPTERQNKLIVAAAKADADAQPLTAKQLNAMVPLRTLRGRPKSPNPKQLVSVRYNPEVLEYFKLSAAACSSSRTVGINIDS
jgi:uncharacterized protein (DUF4415 family)